VDTTFTRWKSKVRILVRPPSNQQLGEVSLPSEGDEAFFHDWKTAKEGPQLWHWPLFSGRQPPGVEIESYAENGMAKQLLRHLHVHPQHPQVGSKGMPEGVPSYALADDPSSLSRRANDLLQDHIGPHGLLPVSNFKVLANCTLLRTAASRSKAIPRRKDAAS
jgi:hypothetical protein